MKYFKIQALSGSVPFRVVAISDQMPAELNSPDGGKLWAAQPATPGRYDGRYVYGSGWISAADISAAGPQSPAFGFVDPLAFAAALAAAAAAAGFGAFCPVDSGPRVGPRYSVIEPPKVGDDASYGFNGDSYPVGKVVKVYASLTRVVVDGPRGKMVFSRKKLSGAWVDRSGWYLIKGAVFKQSPCF